jgi:putative transcriptional regulator
MSINHHPHDEILAAHAAGALDLGQRVAVATHLATCPRCRDWTRAMERVGGALLAEAEPAALSQGALARALARLDEPAPPTPPRPREVDDAPPGLPQFVHGYRFGSWRWVAPRVSLRPIVLSEPSPTRVFLLKAKPNTTLLTHAHSGPEMTCVLTGAFAHGGERYGAGDFDFGDETVEHEPRVEDGEDCICLVAMQGGLQYSGWLGRLMQPFLRL